MRVSHPVLKNAVLDQEDNRRQIVPGAWRNGLNMLDVDDIVDDNRTIRAAKSQWEYST